MSKMRVFVMAMVLALVLAACGEGDDEGGGTAVGEATATVALRDTSLGKVLVDGDGMTLYLFTVDAAGKSNCDGACATTWPPLKANGALTAGAGVDQAKLSAIDRSDGSKQVAYAGKPLYRYAPDKAAGDTTGQGVGGNWFVVGADGEAVKPGSSTPSYGY